MCIPSEGRSGQVRLNLTFTPDLDPFNVIVSHFVFLYTKVEASRGFAQDDCWEG